MVKFCVACARPMRSCLDGSQGRPKEMLQTHSPGNRKRRSSRHNRPGNGGMDGVTLGITNACRARGRQLGGGEASESRGGNDSI